MQNIAIQKLARKAYITYLFKVNRSILSYSLGQRNYMKLFICYSVEPGVIFFVSVSPSINSTYIFSKKKKKKRIVMHFISCSAFV